MPGTEACPHLKCVSLRKTFKKKKNLLETLGGLCNNVFNDALSAIMYVDGYSF